MYHFKKVFFLAFLFGVFFLSAGQIDAANCTAPNVCRSNTCLTGETPVTDVCASGQTCCGSAAAGGGDVVVNFTNPLKFDTVEGVLNSALSAMQGIIVVLAIVFIVIGAILYITSSGDEGRITTAKKAITAALIGLALALAAPSFLKEIGNILGWQEVNNSAAANALTLTEIATKVLNFLLSIVGILAVIMMVVGGVVYLTAAGDESKAETGKKIVTYSIIGIAVAMAALVLVSQVANFFS